MFLPAWSVTAQEKRADDFAALAPFIDDQTLAVARVDLTKFDLAAFQKQIIEPQLRTDPERSRWPRNSTNCGNWPINCAASGGKVYVVVSLAPLPGIQNVGADGHVGAKRVCRRPRRERACTERIDQLLKLQVDEHTPRSAPLVFIVRQELHGVTVVGPQAVLNQLKTASAVARPEFEQALAAGGDRPVAVAVVPPTIFARAAAEMLRDPAPGGDKPLGPILSRGVRWIGAGIEPNLDKFNAAAVIQSADADAANALDKTLKTAVPLLLAQSGFPADKAGTVAVNAVRVLQLFPEVKGDRLVLSLDGQRATDFRYSRNRPGSGRWRPPGGITR